MVFPHPDGPTIEVKLPDSTSKEKSILSSGKLFSNFSNLTFIKTPVHFWRKILLHKKQ